MRRCTQFGAHKSAGVSLIASLAFLTLVLAMATAAPQASALRAPRARRAAERTVLILRGRTLHWTRVRGASHYVVAIHRVRHRASFRVVRGVTFTPRQVPLEAISYRVRADLRGAPWTKAVWIKYTLANGRRQGGGLQPAPNHGASATNGSAAGALSGVLPDSKLKVGVNDASGWGPALDALFLKAGIPYERLDIGRGSLTLVDAAISRGMKVLPVYTSGSTGNLNDVTASIVTSDMSTLIPKLVARGITTLEFGNEVYNSISASQYASLYHAAHVAAAGQIKLIAAATTDYYDKRGGGSGNWFVDMKNSLPGGAAEVDGWTIHPYGSMTSLCGDGYGWPMMGPLHTESVNAGFSASLPWYITEIGQQISGNGLECQGPVSQAVQAADLTQYLTDLKNNYPWVVWLDWYSSCDDSSGAFGLVNKNSAGECGVAGTTVRPAFTAMQTWIAANGQG